MGQNMCFSEQYVTLYELLLPQNILLFSAAHKLMQSVFLWNCCWLVAYCGLALPVKRQH
jgi:hypothetical protein